MISIPGLKKGYFDVCKWLYEAGAKDDVTKESRYGTNMWAACRNGNLHIICKWLWEVSAAADITKPERERDSW